MHRRYLHSRVAHVMLLYDEVYLGNKETSLMTLLVTPHRIVGNFDLVLEHNLDPLLIRTMRSYDDADRQWCWSVSMDCH